MRRKKPSRRPGIPRKPPPNFPRDPTHYGDPENWKFPLDTPRRAKLARRFFSMKRSRKKYTETERIYIDQRIDSALERFGINPEEFQRTVGSSERIPDVVFPEDVDAETLSLDDLLLHFIGKRRMASSKAIRDEELRIDKVTDEFIVARVKEYLVKVDIKSRIFAHNCGDWIAWMSEKLMCKHVAKLLSMMNPEMATNLLRDLCRNKGEWTFSSTPREIFA